MKIALFCHSVVSDWNHDDAHFLRGTATELILSGHEVMIYEPEDSWSYAGLLTEPDGTEAITGYRRAYPILSERRYRELQLDTMLDGVDLAIVHDWNRPELIAAVGRWRAEHSGLRLLFHDTHRRAITAREEIGEIDLRRYDGVLACGEALRNIYLKHGRHTRVWTWHEAADTRVFHPQSGFQRTYDLMWIGNWGDEERTAELREFLIEPCRALGLKAAVYGVRFSAGAREALGEAGIEYLGWLPNFRVPEAFARVNVTVDVPRRADGNGMPGIPTMRLFEALACGIPLVSAPWVDAEGLFRTGGDFLMAESGKQMTRHLEAVLGDAVLAKRLTENGRDTILRRHTCSHRAGELLVIAEAIGAR